MAKSIFWIAFAILLIAIFGSHLAGLLGLFNSFLSTITTQASGLINIFLRLFQILTADYYVALVFSLVIGLAIFQFVIDFLRK